MSSHLSDLAAAGPPGAPAEAGRAQRLAALPQLLPQPPVPKPPPPWAALVQAQDAARKRFAPRKFPRATYCNESVCYIARNNHGSPEEMAPLLNPHGQPALANGMAAALPHSPAWERVGPAEAQRRANLGITVIATIPGMSHVDTVRPQGMPGDKIHPHSRGPLLNNIGYDDRIEGGNWAFGKDKVDQIEYYAPRLKPKGGGQ